jgi:hypothetical protein
MTLNAFLRILMPLQETPAGDTNAPAAVPAAAVPASTTVPASAAASSTAQPGASTGFTYTEDRSKWIPPHRFNEVNTRAQEAATLREQIKERDAKIAALAGLTPADPGSDKAKAIDQAFRAQYPHLVPLLDMKKEDIERLTKTPEQVERASNAEKRESQRHGKSQLSALYSQVAESIGADKLSDDQQSDLKFSFGAWFRSKCAAEIEASSDGQTSATLQRYEDGDPELLKEFVKRYTANWIEPARRRVTQQTLTRTRPVPNSGGRTQVSTVQRPEKFKNLDERIEYAANLAKERGASFQ